MVRVLMVVLLGLGLLLAVPVAHAFVAPMSAEIIVTTTADVLADDGFCSLREAIQAANLDTASGTLAGECVAGIGEDTIVLGVGTYEIEIEGASEDQNLTGDFDIVSSLKINGQGTNTISGNSLDRVLQVHIGSVTLSNLVITSGHAPNGLESQKGADGGSIHNAGTLTLEYVTVTANQAGRGGDGGGAGGHGGAIYNTGTLALEYVTLSENQAGHGGLGYYSGTPGGQGGAIYSTGTLTIAYSRIENNSAGAGGSAWNGSPGTSGQGGDGGGIYIGESAVAQIQQSRINSNAAGDGASAPSCNQPSVCTGALRGGNGGSGGGVLAAGAVLMVNTLIYDNRAGNGGGNSDTYYSTGGDGGSGGGLFVYTSNNSAIKYTTVARNFAGNATGRSSNFGVAGGIRGDFTVTSSVIAENFGYNQDGTTPSDCSGGFVFIGRSFISTKGCAGNPSSDSIIEGYDPQLGANAELLPGSMAIDAGSCPDLTIDFEGQSRRIEDLFMPNFGDACDIGADELALPLLQVGPMPIQVTEGESADLFALVLTQQPSADVTITFTNSQVFVGPQTVRFTPENWNVQQAVGVLAIDNGEINFTRIDYIDMQVESTDPRYNNLAVGNLAVQIRDNDAPMIYLPTVTGRD